MFTQLDLFGDLPAPEKPSNQPQRTEKKSPARSGIGTPNAQSVQTQLSMGLTDHAFPEPSSAWTGQEDVNETEKEAERNIIPSEPEETDGKKHADLLLNKESTTTQTANSAEGSITSQPEDRANNADPVAEITHAENREETRAEKGRRYYIQTEIPADPPLAAKPPGPEMMLAGLVNTRPTAQEPRPKYIQTEIPSDPMNPEAVAEKPEMQNEWAQTEFAVAEPLASTSLTPTDTTDNHAIDRERQEQARPDMPAESLRRTRPLMPPKVIMAEPESQPVVSTAKSPEPEVVSNFEPQVTQEDKVSAPENAGFFHKPKEDRFPQNTDAGVHAVQDSPVPPLASPLSSGAQTIQQTAPRRKKGVKDVVIDSSGAGVPPDDQLNARQYYSIGEVATMFGVKSSLLRYWESEFDVLKLRKNRKGDRFFRPDDIRSLQLIHHLLRDKKYTIEGAREYMRNAGKMKEKFETIETLQRIRQFLVEMRNGLQIERLQDAQ